ncbi:bacteriorhodopsin [Spirosoma fluviale]|uniref:Bacteriorhodopsin-like protein n=1 Tax=Spirosoma fluviale TaxID=1597977 RepID=A0A286G2U0_9BACT|nr:bacteriorhodopsin [Spirosoma fluviale]SOD89793.1 Bacteriorhodopsin-like protein [Spirosoma fluviale]
MEIADSFVPTAGVVGIFPLVTYFFLVVATYIFLGTFIASLAIRPATATQPIQPALILTAVTAAIAGFSYYQIQSHYHTMLAELATVTSPDDRQVLIRESYNAIGQYRFMDWAVTVPLLLIQVVLLRTDTSIKQTRLLITLAGASFFMILTGYIGHQQLGFDNEILVGPKLIWGFVSLLGYAAVARTLLPFLKQANPQPVARLVTISLGAFALAYPLGYFLTLTPIDFNSIHILYTVADVVSKAGMGLAVYYTYKRTIE